MAGAWNLAMALCTTDRQRRSVLAIWLFVDPEQLDAVVTRMMSMMQLPSNDMSHYLHRPDNAGLTDEHLQQLVREFFPHVRVICQRHGTAVYVPVGWMHAVVNVGPCFKYAREVKRDSDLLACALVRRQLRSECASWAEQDCTKPPSEYLAVCEHLRDVIAQITSIRAFLAKLVK